MKLEDLHSTFAAMVRFIELALRGQGTHLIREHQEIVTSCKHFYTYAF